MAGAWLAMSSATHAEEEAGAGEVNGDLLGAGCPSLVAE